MLWSVPFFMGEPLDGLDVPTPVRTLCPHLPQGTPQERMGVLYRHLAGELGTQPVDSLPIVVAGDCVVTAGVLAGLQARGIRPVVVWFDAHGDFHTWETTSSQFIGGMPLAMLTGRGEQTIMAAAGAFPVPDTDAVLVGARDLDPGEDEALAASGITMISVHGLQAVTPPSRPLYVHVDADVVDPVEMPAMNYPATGGPTLEEVRETVRLLVATGRVVAFSVSSWNPSLPGADRAAAGVAVLIDEVRRTRGESEAGV